MRELLKTVTGRESPQHAGHSSMETGGRASRYIDFARAGRACYRVTVRVRRARPDMQPHASDLSSGTQLNAPQDGIRSVFAGTEPRQVIGQGEPTWRKK
jgi:hypothetical protein